MSDIPYLPPAMCDLYDALQEAENAAVDYLSFRKVKVKLKALRDQMNIVHGLTIDAEVILNTVRERAGGDDEA